MDKFLAALKEYIDRHFEYEYYSRQADEGGFRPSCVEERKAMEQAWVKVEDAAKELKPKFVSIRKGLIK